MILGTGLERAHLGKPVNAIISHVPRVGADVGVFNLAVYIQMDFPVLNGLIHLLINGRSRYAGCDLSIRHEKRLAWPCHSVATRNIERILGEFFVPVFLD